jgi:predicted AlkP superfamily pyrophosphatase or phosphodiesterase
MICQCLFKLKSGRLHKTIALLWIFAMAVWVVFFWAENAAVAAPKRVLIVSVDALHPKALSAKSTPHLWRLMNRGTYTLKGSSTDPPKTLVAHTAMFTGLSPDQNKKTDNYWEQGQPRVGPQTIFDAAKQSGYKTGFFYAKPRLGYLATKAADKSILSEEFSLSEAIAFLTQNSRSFVFCHISGLDRDGPRYGWLSEPYMETLKYIDLELGDVFERLAADGDFAIFILSDHAGHGKIHGSTHPEDYRLPLIYFSDRNSLDFLQDQPFALTRLKGILEKHIFQP